MQRRGFITILGGAAAWPLVARAKQTTMPVIGFLSSLPSGERPEHAAFRRGLAEEGYVEGKNLAIEKRFTNFRPELMNEAAGDLVRLEVNVIVAESPEAVAAARNATNSISTVVVDLESDPVAMVFPASTRRNSQRLRRRYGRSGSKLKLLKCRSRKIGDAPWRPPKQGRFKPVFCCRRLLSSSLQSKSASLRWPIDSLSFPDRK